MESTNTDYSVFNAMAAQMTNDKMDSKVEETIRAFLQENNFPGQTAKDLSKSEAA